MSFGRLSILERIMSRSMSVVISFAPNAASISFGFFSGEVEGNSFAFISCPNLSKISEAFTSVVIRSSP